jgi:hypothetical protein
LKNIVRTGEIGVMEYVFGKNSLLKNSNDVAIGNQNYLFEK